MSLLTEAARTLKNHSRFLEDCEEIARRYAREFVLDNRPNAAAVRESLDAFEKRAAALLEWFSEAMPSMDVTKPEQDALLKMNAVHADRWNDLLGQDWLKQRIKTARAARELLPERRNPRSAPRIAAEALVAVCRDHDVEITSTISGPGVALLRAIAAAAGDSSLTDGVAKNAIAEALTTG